MQKKMICSYLFWFVTILDQVQKSASPKYGHEKNDFYISPHFFLSLHTVVSSLRNCIRQWVTHIGILTSFKILVKSQCHPIFTFGRTSVIQNVKLPGMAMVYLISFINILLILDWIQQQILKLQILNFHDFFDQLKQVLLIVFFVKNIFNRIG